MDLKEYSNKKPDRQLNLLFIHHSCGAALLANPGERQGPYCLEESHPNGGGLRDDLKKNNYNVHEATYGSKLGQDTDILDWQPKFKNLMNLILTTKLQDELLDSGETNQIVLFKSCYHNNLFISDGTPPGKSESVDKTVWNAKAAYTGLLQIFRQHPDTLFIAITAPPTIEPWVNKYKKLILNWLGRGPGKMGASAKIFNSWLSDTQNGWLSDYGIRNVAVFDLFYILTKNGMSNWTEYPTNNGRDSHPNSQGNTIAAEKFIDFINRAVRFAKLTP